MALIDVKINEMANKVTEFGMVKASMSVAQFEGSVFGSFPISSGVKQGCVLAPTLFGIFFSVVLATVFDTTKDGVYIYCRKRILVRELLFADAAALVSHPSEGLQNLIDALINACRKFGLSIRLSKTEILAQGRNELPAGIFFAFEPGHCINNARRIAKASGVMAKHSNHVWENTKLTTANKILVYSTCILSTLLYSRA
ncbi:hypothetical protein HELRODRAFT_171770 [Helobdella robusta]|uniref:Reverse transcriptase domain-containing protein n=1 Tax=Helobdella robusta TaxID=6412 RepID=T1F4N0_HELRO|nr:hypothetical protein HELRODRAFT_171770 [Helobdella robusta]ESO05378.1 hypothetical protein HELRODRAFT_171770 [Helobdella robusta]